MDRRAICSWYVRLMVLTCFAGCGAASSGELENGNDHGSADGCERTKVDVIDGAAAPDDALAVTQEGQVRGSVESGIRVFRGIPYAAKPCGSRRWKPPVAPPPRSGVLDTKQFAPHCPQSQTDGFGIASNTEDCLYLNIWTPDAGDSAGGSALPVMVWFHGGSLMKGESDDFTPTRLVRAGVVVVTLNYRLGALGFLASEALQATGNDGLLDQAEALRWVQRNVASFGGDPSNVTLFGESAGGLSVYSHLASRGSSGLFQRAIAESGAYHLTQSDLASAQAAGRTFGQAAGCTGAQPDVCLRKISVDKILSIQAALGWSDVNPTIDQQFMTKSIGAALDSGDFNRVPILAGSNHDEWRLFIGISELLGVPVTAANFQAQVHAFGLGTSEAAALQRYSPSATTSPPLALAALGTDLVYACSARHLALSASQRVPVYAYEFSDPAAPQVFVYPASFPYGAAHASEVQYLMDLRRAVNAPSFTADQQQLADTMVSYWTTFARTGRPSADDAPAWSPYSADSESVQSLVTPAPVPGVSFATDHQCDFWDSRLR